MKRRIIEREYANGDKRWIIQKKGFFSWIYLDKKMLPFGIHHYKSFEEAKEALYKSTGQIKTKVIYESNN